MDHKTKQLQSAAMGGIALLAMLAFRRWKNRTRVVDTRRGAVFVTGTSTGIGRSVALVCARRGFTVFAAVRKQADGDSLVQASEGVPGTVHPVIMDVCDVEAVERAVANVGRMLTEHNLTLCGIVNNAGVGCTGPLECCPLKDMRKCIEVHVLGAMYTTRAFVPLLRAAGPGQEGGRVVNISSISGLLAVPNMSVYTASKFALEGFTNSLRLELRPQGIRVVSVQPGLVKTHFTATCMEAYGNDIAAGEGLSEEVKARYPKHIEKYKKRIQSGVTGDGLMAAGVDPDFVGEATYDALTVRNPERGYIVGKEKRIVKTLLLLPAKWADVMLKNF